MVHCGYESRLEDGNEACMFDLVPISEYESLCFKTFFPVPDEEGFRHLLVE